MKRVEDFTVLGHKWLNYKTFIIDLEASEQMPPILPGNFAEIEIKNSPRVFLRRPFSVFDINPSSNIISFFIKVVGEGSRLLGETRKGEIVNLIYPLGNSFTLPGGERILVIAGGSGVAPFVLYARHITRFDNRITFLFGGKTGEDIVLLERFRDYGEVFVTTEDGSLGEKGLVTQHSLFDNSDMAFDRIVTCGPDPMMKAVARIAASRDIPCEVSLENTMACGFGACLCCIVETVNGNKCVCTEGPVFNIKDLKWQTSQ